MNDILMWIIGGLVAVLSVVIGGYSAKIKKQDMTIEKQKQKIAVKAVEKKAVEELTKAAQEQADDENIIDREKQKVVEQIKEAEGRGDTDEAIKIANDIVAGFNSRHKL